MVIEELRFGHREDADRFLEEYFGYTMIVLRKGEIYDAKGCPGFAARGEGGEITGALVYKAADGVLEILMVCAQPVGCGTGTALLSRAVDKAKELGCRAVRVVTTNDNLDAVGFYQKRGFRLKALYLNAMDYVRAVKPYIPALGERGIPLCDQLQLEMEI